MLIVIRSNDVNVWVNKRLIVDDAGRFVARLERYLREVGAIT